MVTMIPTDVQAEFKRRAMTAHPDHGGSDAEFAELVAWRDKMLGQSVILGNIKMQYLTNPSEGIWVGQSSVVYKTTVAGFNWQFASDKMRDEMSRFLPQLAHDFNGYVAYRRTSDQILMSDLMRLYGPIPSEHVSWMVSRMLNIACYLNWAGLSHCGFDPNYLLVDLKNHGVSLTGPCQFMTKMGTRPEAVPARTFQVFPYLSNKSTVACPEIDLSCIRQIGLELIGDRGGNRIKNQWFQAPCAKTAFEDYDAWIKTLGERKFVVFPKTVQEIYNGCR